MADTSIGTNTTRTARRVAGDYQEPTGWVGWNVFAGVMMLIAGSLQVIYGIVAVVDDDWVVWGHRANLYIDLTTWGWIHIGIGGVVFLSGVGVFSGNIVARTIGVILAAGSLISNFLFVPAYPFWSITVMVLAALVIWALTAHGHEMRELSRMRPSDVDLRPPVRT